MTERRVAITGQGIVSPLGNDPDTFFGALLAGKSGIGRLQADFVEILDCKIGAQASLDPLAHFSKSEAAALDRISQFALVAARQSIACAGLEMASLDLSRTGICLG